MEYDGLAATLLAVRLISLTPQLTTCVQVLNNARIFVLKVPSDARTHRKGVFFSLSPYSGWLRRGEKFLLFLIYLFYNNIILIIPSNLSLSTRTLYKIHSKQLALKLFARNFNFTETPVAWNLANHFPR